MSHMRDGNNNCQSGPTVKSGVHLAQPKLTPQNEIDRFAINFKQPPLPSSDCEQLLPRASFPRIGLIFGSKPKNAHFDQFFQVPKVPYIDRHQTDALLIKN